MPKHPEIGPTVGKVTYIHGAAPRELPIVNMAMQQRTSLDQLNAAEADISQHAYEFPPEGLRVRPDGVPAEYVPMPSAPSIAVYGSVRGTVYGTKILPLGPHSITGGDSDVTVLGYFGISGPQSEPDPEDFWDPDPRRSDPPPLPSDAPSLLLVAVILTLMTVLGVAILNLFPSTIFAEFLQSLTIPR